ncbi:putative serpin-like protein [Aphelenchoides fujianensis]|nr:putative serpin-like protein [Aphelenchoides fujianensis]
MADVAFVAAQTDFAVGLLRKAIAGSNTSVILSPISIAFALSLAYAGAGGDTRREFERVFAKGGIAGNALDSHFHHSFAQLTAANEEKNRKMELCPYRACPGQTPDVAVELANRLYASHDLQVKAAYKQLIVEKFGGHLEQVDFGRSEEVVKKVNDFVANATHDNIRDLLSSDFVNSDTKLLLVNAVYFKAAWEDRFSKGSTRSESFFIEQNNKQQVHMMKMRRLQTYYAETDDVQVLELPYKDERATFLVFLPKQRFGLSSWLQKVDGRGVLELMSRLETRKVNIDLPRFKTTSQFQLVQMLQKLGFSKGFDQTADFSGISDERLFISDGVHKAFIEVNENGSEAAAATAWKWTDMSAVEDSEGPVRFRADHPFAFLITYDKLPLFFGRFSGPSS